MEHSILAAEQIERESQRTPINREFRRLVKDLRGSSVGTVRKTNPLAWSILSQALARGKQSEFHPIGHQQLVKNPSHVVLYSELADAEALGDFPVPHSLYDGLYDFQFSACEAEVIHCLA